MLGTTADKVNENSEHHVHFTVLTAICSCYQFTTEVPVDDPELFSNEKKIQNTVKASLLDNMTTTWKHKILSVKVQEATW